MTQLRTEAESLGWRSKTMAFAYFSPFLSLMKLLSPWGPPLGGRAPGSAKSLDTLFVAPPFPCAHTTPLSSAAAASRQAHRAWRPQRVWFRTSFMSAFPC